MAFGYRIKDQQGTYFVTFTVEQWVDVFTRKEYVEIVINSLIFCQTEKGLLIYAWVIMTNHLHMIISCKEGSKLSDIIRDFKKFMSRKIVSAIGSFSKESRKCWLQFLLIQKTTAGTNEIAFWQDGNHAEEIYDLKFFCQKRDYIHFNPVKSGYVSNPEHWCWSSARNSHGGKGQIELSYWND